MNRAMMFSLADFIERPETDLNMGRWDKCILGQAAELFGFPARTWFNISDGKLALSEALKIGLGEVEEMLLPKTVPIGYVSKQDAVDMLRRFANTGELKWEVTPPANARE